MAVGLADNRGNRHQQSLPDEVGVRVSEDEAIVAPRDGTLPVSSGVLRSRWDVLLVISAGGALGSLARWGVGELLPWSGEEFPWATFAENISGGFALGMLMVFLMDVWPPHRYLRPFLGVGLLGGYTTFSTSMLESRDLFVADEAATAFMYLAASLVAGLTAVWLGIFSARAAVRPAQHRRQRRTTRPTNPRPDRRSTP
jgi:CrcB protein